MIYRVWGIPTRSCTILHDLARSGEMIYRVWGIPTRSCTILHDLARSCIALNIFALAQESQQGALHCITLKTIHYAIHYDAMQCQNVREPYLSWFRYITCLHTYRDWDMHKQIYQQEYWCIYIYTHYCCYNIYIYTIIYIFICVRVMYRPICWHTSWLAPVRVRSHRNT